jgi:hypothetical protein
MVMVWSCDEPTEASKFNAGTDKDTLGKKKSSVELLEQPDKIAVKLIPAINSSNKNFGLYDNFSIISLPK